mgnify:FL=1
MASIIIVFFKADIFENTKKYNRVTIINAKITDLDPII